MHMVVGDRSGRREDSTWNRTSEKLAKAVSGESEAAVTEIIVLLLKKDALKIKQKSKLIDSKTT